MFCRRRDDTETNNKQTNNHIHATYNTTSPAIAVASNECFWLQKNRQSLVAHANQSQAGIKSHDRRPRPVINIRTCSWPGIRRLSLFITPEGSKISHNTKKYTKLHTKIWHKITQKYTHTHNKTIKKTLKEHHIKEECDAYGWSTALLCSIYCRMSLRYFCAEIVISVCTYLTQLILGFYQKLVRLLSLRTKF